MSLKHKFKAWPHSKALRAAWNRHNCYNVCKLETRFSHCAAATELLFCMFLPRSLHDSYA